MSKDCQILELNVAVVEVANEVVLPLDNLSLVLIGGGEATASI